MGIVHPLLKVSYYIKTTMILLSLHINNIDWTKKELEELFKITLKIDLRISRTLQTSVFEFCTVGGNTTF